MFRQQSLFVSSAFIISMLIVCFPASAAGIFNLNVNASDGITHFGKKILVEAAECSPSKLAQADTTPITPQASGCCSSHNGVCGCSNGRSLCCDGTLSPTCTCSSPITYSVSVARTGSGSGTVGGNGSYAAGTTINLTAIPDTGSTFASWSPIPCAASFTMPASNLICTATFTITSYTVTTIAGTGGTFSAPSRLVDYGKTTSFILTPNPGYQIGSVTGCGGNLSGTTYTTGLITGNCTINASFKATSTPSALTVTKAGTGSGSVSGEGSYATGVIVNLTATPDSGSIFVGWSPTPCAANFAMPANNLICTATFNKITGSAVGVFRDGQWFLDANGNGAWDGCETEFCFTGFGQAGDMPASGNWDGGGKSYIGVLRSGTGEWFIDRNGNRQWDGCTTDGCYVGFGSPGDLPVAGDWTGSGFAKIGVFRNGQWFLDNGNGKWDGCGTELCLSFGQAGDLPAAGNWDGGLKAGVGVFRAGTWYLDYNGNGVWDGCDADRCYVGTFGQAGDFPAAGDWNGDGKAKVGVFRAGTWYLDYNGNGAWDGCNVDRCYSGSFGQQGDLPVAGKW